MKNIILLLSLLLFTTVKSQNYIPFPDSNATWSVVNFTKEECCFSYDYAIIGDTIINNYVYNKIYENSSDVLFGGIREDSLKRIYFYGNMRNVTLTDNSIQDTVKEYLLYQFGLNIGDSVLVNAHQTDSFRVILNIDSVEVNGEYRLRYLVSNPYLISSDYWIEGVGSESGLFGPYSWEFENEWRLCEFQQSGVSIWPDSGSRCLTVSVEEIGLPKEIKVYPNPTQNMLHFETSSLNQQIKSVRILGLNGENIIQTEQASINISQFPQGVYFYQVEMKNGVLAIGKFVKE